MEPVPPKAQHSPVGIHGGVAETLSFEPTVENDALWHAVFEEGEDGAGSFNLIRNGTFLARVGESEFEVVARTAFAKRFAEQKRQQLEAIMAHKLGRSMRMLCVEEKEYQSLQAQSGSQKQADGSAGDPQKAQLAQMAREALGIDIEIE